MSASKILIALNQSESSQAVIPAVERLFPPAACELILYYVTRPPSAAGFGEPDLGAGYAPLPGDEPVMPTLHPIYESQQRDSIKAHVRAELQPLSRRLGEAGYTVSVKVGFSKQPADAIMRYLEQTPVDLIAMSTLGRVGVTRFFFRNLADRLAERSKLPLLLVHPGA